MRCARLKGRTCECMNVSRKALSLAGKGAKRELRDGFTRAWRPPALRARRNALQAKRRCTDRDASRLATARRDALHTTRNVRRARRFGPSAARHGHVRKSTPSACNAYRVVAARPNDPRTRQQGLAAGAWVLATQSAGDRSAPAFVRACHGCGLTADHRARRMAVRDPAIEVRPTRRPVCRHIRARWQPTA